MCLNFTAFKWDVLTEEGVKFKVKDIWKGRAANVRAEGERKRSKNSKDTKLEDFTVWKER